MTEKRHGKGLLFIVTLVLAAGVIKYADIPSRRPCAKRRLLPCPARQMLTMFLRYSAALPCPQIPFLRNPPAVRTIF